MKSRFNNNCKKVETKNYSFLCLFNFTKQIKILKNWTKKIKIKKRKNEVPLGTIRTHSQVTLHQRSVNCNVPLAHFKSYIRKRKTIPLPFHNEAIKCNAVAASRGKKEEEEKKMQQQQRTADVKEARENEINSARNLEINENYSFVSVQNARLMNQNVPAGLQSDHYTCKCKTRESYTKISTNVAACQTKKFTFARKFCVITCSLVVV